MLDPLTVKPLYQWLGESVAVFIIGKASQSQQSLQKKLHQNNNHEYFFNSVPATPDNVTLFIDDIGM